MRRLGERTAAALPQRAISRPRLLAAGVMFLAGTAYAAALGKFVFTSPSENFASRFAHLDCTAAIAAAWAFALFGPGVARPESGSAVLRGAACVFLALVTWAFISVAIGITQDQIAAPHSGMPNPIAASLVALLLFPVAGSMVLCLTPEFVGCLAGYVIWRLLRSRAGE